MLPWSISPLHYLFAFPVSTFRVIIAFQFRCSEPPSLFNFGIKSHHRLSVSVFRAIIIAFQFRRSESSSSLLNSNVQSHHRFSVSAFRAIIIAFGFGVQSHHHFFLVLAFKATIAVQFRRLESS